MDKNEKRLEEYYANRLLGDCTRWIKARVKRHAKPVKIIIDDVDFPDTNSMSTTLSDSPDEIASWLFNASLMGKCIFEVDYYRDHVNISLHKFAGKDTNISLAMMETILSWFNMHQKGK